MKNIVLEIQNEIIELLNDGYFDESRDYEIETTNALVKFKLNVNVLCVYEGGYYTPAEHETEYECIITDVEVFNSKSEVLENISNKVFIELEKTINQLFE